MTRDHYRAELTELRLAVSGKTFAAARDKFVAIDWRPRPPARRQPLRMS